eukprot:138291-Hanusia_phi.AAC.3
MLLKGMGESGRARLAPSHSITARHGNMSSYVQTSRSPRPHGPEPQECSRVSALPTPRTWTRTSTCKMLDRIRLCITDRSQALSAVHRVPLRCSQHRYRPLPSSPSIRLSSTTISGTHLLTART